MILDRDVYQKYQKYCVSSEGSQRGGREGRSDAKVKLRLSEGREKERE